MEYTEKIHEIRDMPPLKPLARLIVMRHFPSTYREREGIYTENYDLIDTPEQREKNRKQATRIARMFRDQDVVEFWTSPRQRTLGTKEVLKHHIKMPIVKDKIIPLLGDVQVPAELYGEFLQEVATGGWVSKYHDTPPEGKAGKTRIESVDEVAQRFSGVFHAFSRFVQTIEKGGEIREVTNIIAVTHGEVPDTFLESVFGFGFSHHADYKRKEIGRGEFLIIEARCAIDNTIHFFAKMRGEKVEFAYDPQNRAFQLKRQKT